MRIVAAFLLVVATTLSAVVFLMVQYQGVARAQALVTEGYLPLSLQVDQMRGDQQRVDTDVQRLLAGERRPTTGAESAAMLYSERLRETLLETRVHARGAVRLASDPVDVAALNKTQVHLARIEELVKTYQGSVQGFVQRSEQGDRAGAAAIAEPLRQDARALGDEIDKLAGLVGQQVRRLTAEIDRARARANTVAVGLTALAVALAVAGLVAVLAALRPIVQLTDHVQRLARGERPGRTDVRGTDEVALLAREFDRMVEALEVRDRALVERAEQLGRLSRYLGSVLDSLEDGLFVVEGGLATLANPAATRLWGVRPDAPPPDGVRPWLEAGVYEHRADGAEHEVRAVPFGQDGVVVVTSDVTDQRRATEKLARSERLALVGQMLAQITHEVRNPLNAISLNAEMLGDELTRLDPARGSEAWALLGTVSGEIERLTAVTAHYLQLARRPKATLQREDLAEVIADVARLLHAELGQQGVELTVACAPVPPQRADGNQLRQALLNVVRNAVEAGARHVRVSLEADEAEVRVALADDGPGMTSEQVERAFDPFYSTKATGTGLGLAITRQILEDHDGTVRVASTLGRGTTVTLVLPPRPDA